MVTEVSCVAPAKSNIVNLDNFPIFAHTPPVPVRTKDHIIFSNRSFYLDRKAFDRYHHSITNYLKEEHLSEESKVMLYAHWRAIEDSLESERSYTTLSGGLQVDEKNELELIGAPIYAKSYQIIYDFSKHIDILLTYLCGMKYDELCESLEQNLIKFGVNYNIFSTAVMTNNVHLLHRIPLGVMFGLSNQLDTFFRNVVANRSKGTFRMRGDSIPTQKLTDGELIYSAISLQLTELLQYIFESFVGLYNNKLLFNEDSQHYITSKGYANIVLQADAYANPQPFTITFDDMTFEIKPYISTRGEYYKIFEEG